MPVQLHTKQGATLYRRTPEELKSKPHSMLGENGTNDYTYEAIIDHNKTESYHEIKNRKEEPNDSLAKAKKTQEKTFRWLYGGRHVLLTGDFDSWKGTIEMNPAGDNVFVAHVNNLDASRDIHYKFIVDGVWRVDENEDILKDDEGNINNVIHANK